MDDSNIFQDDNNSIPDEKIDRIDDLEDTQTDDYGDYAESDTEYDETAEPMDIDEMMKSTLGNVPSPGQAFSIAEEIEEDEEDRRGM